MQQAKKARGQLCLPSLLVAYFKHTGGVGKQKAFLPAKAANVQSVATPKAHSPEPKRGAKTATWPKWQRQEAVVLVSTCVG